MARNPFPYKSHGMVDTPFAQGGGVAFNPSAQPGSMQGVVTPEIMEYMRFLELLRKKREQEKLAAITFEATPEAPGQTILPAARRTQEILSSDYVSPEDASNVMRFRTFPDRASEQLLAESASNKPSLMLDTAMETLAGARSAGDEFQYMPGTPMPDSSWSHSGGPPYIYNTPQMQTQHLRHQERERGTEALAAQAKEQAELEEIRALQFQRDGIHALQEHFPDQYGYLTDWTPQEGDASEIASERAHKFILEEAAHKVDPMGMDPATGLLSTRAQDEEISPLFANEGQTETLAKEEPKAVAAADNNAALAVNQGTGTQTGQEIVAATARNSQANPSTVYDTGSNTLGQNVSETIPWEARQFMGLDLQAQRQRYLNALNDMFTKAIILNVIANLTGGESNAGLFMEMAHKKLDAISDFDGKDRLQRISRLVYFNADGSYNPPKSKKDLFDRVIRVGGTNTEAQHISGMPAPPAADTKTAAQIKVDLFKEADADLNEAREAHVLDPNAATKLALQRAEANKNVILSVIGAEKMTLNQVMDNAIATYKTLFSQSRHSGRYMFIGRSGTAVDLPDGFMTQWALGKKQLDPTGKEHSKIKLRKVDGQTYYEIGGDLIQSWPTYMANMRRLLGGNIPTIPPITENSFNKYTTTQTPTGPNPWLKEWGPPTDPVLTSFTNRRGKYVAYIQTKAEYDALSSGSLYYNQLNENGEPNVQVKP
jgi:hypothetical protein